MRLYRGQRIDDGEWVYGYYRKIEYMGVKRNPARHFIYPSPTSVQEIVDPATVGQSTGLKDKDGVEIYEGSDCKFGHKKKNRDLGKVVYEPDFCAFGCWQNNLKKPRFHFCCEDFEVIHDPEPTK